MILAYLHHLKALSIADGYVLIRTKGGIGEVGILY
jgi:hypothetical protein